ncbi:hypothetical protein M0R45_014202 [Rubus argutus]|uniref:25S rRNA (uridine-N(3))-methyltransferase BMT5-like domain-containing protein n=1 Tax=Rubus argutus TaxID=59490 RepID=A0AAW1XNA5_RUBAR
MAQEKKIVHYSSSQKILLVGEGDFSFAICLAKAFGSASNMLATSLNSREELGVNYSNAMNNLKELEDRGCTILHGVDVHTMSQHPDLIYRRFDCIIYNFPHAGYVRGFSSSESDNSQILAHKKFVKGYFMSARQMLSICGQIHVTHKTRPPFTEWRIVKLAEDYRRPGCFCLKKKSSTHGNIQAM